MGTINSLSIPFLIDSGASVSILRKDIFDSIPLELRPQVIPVRMNLLTATGAASEFSGKVDLEIKLGNHVCKHEFLLAEIKDAAIIGTDFMSRFHIDILFTKGSLRIGNDFIPYFTNQGEVSCCKVSIAETVEVPPHSEMIIKGHAFGRIKYNSIGIVETNKEFIEKTGLLLARSVIQQNSNTIPLRVINFSEDPIKVHKNTVAGLFEPVDVQQVVSVDKPKESVNCIKVATEKEMPEHLIEVFEKGSDGLCKENKNQLKDFLCSYADVFSTSSSDIGHTELIKHKINTGNAPPIKQRPYRLPLAKREAAEKEIETMASRGIIEPSSSAWCSPVVMVKKTDESIRFCCDFRKLNSITLNDCQPLPRIDDTLDALSGNKWFSTLDMRSGYWQCDLEESDREKTAFAIPGSGLWQFKVLCFGLSGAPATFERLVERIFSGLTWKICLVYLDDIIVYSKDFEEHLRNLREVCDRLRQSNLKLHPGKCVLTRSEVTFLGHRVTQDGIRTDEAKISAVRDWPVPKNVKDTRSFIGFCSYYRRFVKDFAIVAKPLHKLTEKGSKFNWSVDCQEAFTKLKELLITAPVLGYPLDKGEFTLDCDASFYGMGAVLSQMQDGIEKPIAYYSKTFSKCEKNYCVTRKELLAIVLAVKNFHHYLYGRKFIVRSDHGSLRWLMNFKNPEGQLARWLEVLGGYQFTIIHRPGRIHCNADALSRRPCPENCSHCSKKETQASASVVGVLAHDAEAGVATEQLKNDQVKAQVNPGLEDVNTIHNEAFTNDKCVYGKTLVCPNPGTPMEAISNKECMGEKLDSNQINPSCQGPMTYQMLMPTGETLTDVCWSDSSTKGQMDFDVRAVQTRSMKKTTPEILPNGLISSKESDDFDKSLDLQKEQEQDNILGIVRQWLVNSTKPEWSEISKYGPGVKFYWTRLESFDIKDGVLYRKWESDDGSTISWLIVLPEIFKDLVLKHLHDSAMGGGHLGVKKTLSKVRQRYFWFGVRKFVERWCHKCDVCASRKSPVCKAKAPMRQYNVGAPLERVAMDIMGPLPTSEYGNKHVLVIGDYFTKFVHAIPIVNQEAQTVARAFIENFVTIFGVPMQLHTDQGANFEARVFQELCKVLDIDKTRTTVMRPQSDGMAERYMRTVVNMLASFVSEHQRDWDQYIPLVMMAYRSSEHETTGVTPCQMMFGREINLPVDLVMGRPFKESDGSNPQPDDYLDKLEQAIGRVHELARRKMNLSSNSMKKTYDHKIHHTKYNVGDHVWYYQYQRKVGRNPKFQRPWHGPYVVISRLNDVLYRIKMTPKSKPKVVHHDKLKRYVGENSPTWFQQSSD